MRGEDQLSGSELYARGVLQKVRKKAAAPFNRAKRLSDCKPSVCRDLGLCRPIARVSACMPVAKRLRHQDYSDCTGTQSQREPLLRAYSLGEPERDHRRGLGLLEQMTVKCMGSSLPEMGYTSLTLAKYSSQYRDCSYLAALLSLINHTLKGTVHHLQRGNTENQLLLTPGTFVLSSTSRLPLIRHRESTH